ncbi:MAG: sugar phosphate isomerase/epimerase [Candidatus Bathyarchaeia archaeon]
MILAASTHNVKEPFEVWLRDLVSLGFKYLDLEFFKVPEGAEDKGIQRPFGFGSKELRVVKEFVERDMMRVVGIEAGALFLDGQRTLEESEKRVKNAINLARELGGPTVSFTPFSMSKRASKMEEMVELCTKLCEYGENIGIKLALENGERGSPKLLKSPEELLTIISKVNHKNLGICLDFAAAATYDFNVARYASKILDHILILHVNDITEDLRFKNIIVGLGDLDFPSILKLFKGRDIPMVIEIFSGYGAIDLFLCKRQIERIFRKL